MLRSPRTLLLIALGAALLATVAGVLTQQPAPAPEPAPPAQAGPSPEPIAQERLKIGAGRAQQVTATVGEPLRLTIDGAGAPDVVEIIGLDQTQQISPDLAAVFDLLPDAAGDYPIALQESGERVGALRVSAG